MAQKLELEIILDSKGAVQGVKVLDDAMIKLDKTTKTADKSTGGLGAQMVKTAAGYVAGAFAITKVVGVLGDSIKEAIEAEKINAQLSATLRAEGENVEVMAEVWDDFAAQMQAMTGESDETIKSLVALGYNLGIAGDRMDEAVKGAIGLTTSFGGSLQGNLEAVAKAYQGQWMQAERLIPELKNVSGESDKLALLQKKMAEGFIASTDAMSGQAGQLVVIKNQWNDFKESVGNGLLTLWNGISKVSAAMTHQTAIFNKLKAQNDYRIEQLKIEEQLTRKYSDVVLKETDSYDKLNAVEQGQFILMAQYAGLLPSVTSATEGQTKAVKVQAQEVKTLNQILEERWKSLNQSITEDQAYAAFIEAKFTPAIESASDAWGENIDVEKLAQEEMDKLQPRFDEQGKQILNENIPATKEWTINWKDANEVLQFAQNMVAGLTDLLGALGVELGSTGDALMQMASGGGQIWAGIASKNPLQVIQGVTQALTGIVNLFKGDGVGEAIRRENEWMNLNEDLRDQLKELAKEMGSVHEATSVMFDQIIQDADIGVENFGQYTIRLREILSDLDSGAMSASEATAEIGDAFDALISKAHELGTEGSAELLSFFDYLAARGMNVAEVQEYIQEQMNFGLEGYKKFLEGGFSDATIGVFESLLAYQKKVAENQELIDGVHGITDALVGMSNATRLTEEEFDKFEVAARDAFDALRKKGFTEKESLVELAPMLSRMIFLHNEYGLAIDAETQKLIEKAKKEGVNLEQYKSEQEIFGDISNSLRELVDLFGRAFPNAIGKTTEAFRGLNNESSKFDSDYTLPPNQDVDLQAASGFYSPALPRDTVIQAHRGEEVVITPRGKTGSDGPRSTKMDVHITGVVNPYTVADAWMVAYRSNLRGVRSTIEREM